MRIYDFRCPMGHVTEEMVQNDTQEITCECGSTATRIISPGHFALPGHSTDWPTAHQKWVREHENAGRKNQR